MPAGIGVRVSSRGRGSCQSPKNGAGEVLNTRVDSHSIMQLRIERNFSFQFGLEVGPVCAPEVRAIRWVLKG
jgi:hypothetical protein